MSIMRDASPSSAFSSSSVNWTYWSLANSYPLVSVLRSTTSLQVGQIICWRTRPPHLGWSWLNDTPPAEAAVYMRMGIETRPNEMLADPVECGGIVSPSRWWWSRRQHRGLLRSIHGLRPHPRTRPAALHALPTPPSRTLAPRDA